MAINAEKPIKDFLLTVLEGTDVEPSVGRILKHHNTMEALISSLATSEKAKIVQFVVEKAQAKEDYSYGNIHRALRYAMGLRTQDATKNGYNTYIPGASVMNAFEAEKTRCDPAINYMKIFSSADPLRLQELPKGKELLETATQLLNARVKGAFGEEYETAIAVPTDEDTPAKNKSVKPKKESLVASGGLITSATLKDIDEAVQMDSALKGEQAWREHAEKEAKKRRNATDEMNKPENWAPKEWER